MLTGVELEPEVQILGEVEWPADWELGSWADGLPNDGESSSSRSTRTKSKGSASERSLPSWRVTRRWLIVAVILAAALIAGYMLWFRDSSFVAVEKVNVTGADTSPRRWRAISVRRRSG